LDASLSIRESTSATPALDGQTITLTGGELRIGQSLSIVGPGATELTISGNGASRVMYINAGAVAISGLTVTAGNGMHPSDGSTNQGDDIDIEGASTSVTLDRLAITGANGSLFGGGIGFSEATVAVTSSTIAANTVTGFAIGGGNTCVSPSWSRRSKRLRSRRPRKRLIVPEWAAGSRPRSRSKRGRAMSARPTTWTWS
jgi:hypothetical protein